MLVYFRKDVIGILLAIGSMVTGKGRNGRGKRLFLWIVVASLPTGIMGLLLKDWFESLFSKPNIVGGMLLVTGSIVYLTRWTRSEGRALEEMKWTDAILIGVAQGIAIIPGISRSGATISMGLFCGLNRELAGRFSFLLSVPAIFGAMLHELKKAGFGDNMLPILTGTAIAFGVGLVSLNFLMKVIRFGRVVNFSYYCWGVGILMIFLT